MTQRAGCEVLTALVSEFSVASASPLGLPWDYHDRACRDMEERYLQVSGRYGIIHLKKEEIFEAFTHKSSCSCM